MGVGFPADLWLHEFGSKVWEAFGTPPYLVGSALEKKEGWRDVDVRLLLSRAEWETLGLPWPPDVPHTHSHPRWTVLCLAFSALGRQMTGLPIDFQIQEIEWANAEFKDRPRSALGVTPLRLEIGRLETSP
jgi:hypothetical protein